MPVYRLDAVGYVCPVPLLKTKQKFAEMLAGDVLVVTTEHSRSVKNILDWAFREGHPIEVEESEHGLWILTILKR